MSKNKTDNASSQAGGYFEGPDKYYDRNAGHTVVKVYSGGYHVSTSPHEMIMTVLGSCIAACIFDPRLGVGGMNHFLLPGDEKTDSNCARFGVNAMELLLNGLYKLGATKDTLQVKLFGGANVLPNSSAAIGTKNIIFIRDFIKKEGLKVASEDLGGVESRRLNFFPSTGRVMLKKLQMAQEDQKVIKEELNYINSLKQPLPPKEDDAILF
jgi:chemotaxis protein CheD